MTTSANQEAITTKGAAHNKENIYATIGIEPMKEAMNLLKPNTFKLWCYMAKNQNDFTFALSCVDACNYCGFTKNTFHTSVNELIEAGYLVADEGNHYNFYEKLPEVKEMEITVHKDESNFTF